MSDSLSHQPGHRKGDPALYRHLLATRAAERSSFHMPGHKGGAGAPELGVALFGLATYEADVSEMGGFDYLHGPHSAINDAQDRAATIFGAEQTWFLVNGSTVGNIAAICSVVSDGEEIIVARGSHRSVYAGITLSGASPIYLSPVANKELDGLFGIDLDELRAAIDAHPNAKAVHITSPSYYGFTVNLLAIARIAHKANMALIVDEAHGSHFIFHPELPKTALAAGADITIQSPHKTIGSLTQSSLLHNQGSLVDPARVTSWLQILQSSSPSALLTVSLDIAVTEMAESGEQRWDAALDLASYVREEMTDVKGITLYDDEVMELPAIDDFDPAKIVVDVHDLGITGFHGEAWLIENQQIHPEFSDLRRMVFSLTTGDNERTAGVLVDALKALAGATHTEDHEGNIASLWPHAIPEMVYTPRIGAMQKSVKVAASEAIGRICAEMIVPYPPGIPLLVPGERIDAATLDALQQLLAAGSKVVGMSDRTGKSIRCS